MDPCSDECVCVGKGYSPLRCLPWRRALGAVIAALFFGVGFAFLTRQGALAHAESSTLSCYLTSDVADAVAEGRCLVVFAGGVYDVTEGEKWGIEGHVGQHQCGGIYTRPVIEEGPHDVLVLEQFYVAPICGEEAERADEHSQEVDTREAVSIQMSWGRPFGMPWRVLFAYLAGVFFVLNFLTCYAMPWARTGAPWSGERPGEDEKDPVGHFPLTHWHPWFAWGAIFFLTLHGVLGFLCAWGVACL